MISVDNAKHYHWGNGCEGWHLVQSAALSVIQERVPPGCSEQRHYHRKAEQFFFVLEGQAILEVAGTEHKLTPQQGLHVPAAVPHCLSNRSDEPLIFTVTSTPPSHGDRENMPDK